MSPQDNQHENSSNVPEQIKEPSQIQYNVLSETPPQTEPLHQPKSKHKVIRKIALILVIILVAAITLIAVAIIRNKLSTDSEHNKLLNEISSLNLSSSKPQIIGFENEPTNPELLISDSYPGVHLTLNISQTTLGDEVNSIKGALQNQQFKIQYDPQNTPDDIIGTSKNYFINIGIEYNGAGLSLVNTGQKSTFNGEPIFAEPGSDTKVNGLQINIEDSSKLNTGL